MKIIRAAEAKVSPAGGALYLGEIGFSLMAGTPATGQVEVYRVDFAAGARNRVHVHRHDQVLIGCGGVGIVADESGHYSLGVGDVVTIPSGHPHWHGAGPEGVFSHLTVAVPGDEIEIVDGDVRGAWGAIDG